MKQLLQRTINVFPAANAFHMSILVFRVLLSLELMYAHGLKKLAVGVTEVEKIPNPLHLPEALNNSFAVAANLIFPLFVIVGLLTRLAILPILGVTLTGYFVLHFHDVPLVKDTPFMYSLSYFLLLVLGSGKYSLDYYLDKKFWL